MVVLVAAIGHAERVEMGGRIVEACSHRATRRRSARGRARRATSTARASTARSRRRGSARSTVRSSLRSLKPNWMHQRRAASSRSATRRHTWSMRRRRDHGSSLPSRTRSSASSSGIARATCSVLAETCELIAGTAQIDVPVDDRVGQARETLDLDLDDIAGLHRAAVGRRAREDDIAGLERDQPAEVGELVAVVPDDVVLVAALDDLAVQVRLGCSRRRVTTRPGTTAGPIGRKPSWPLTRSIDPRSAWRKSCRPASLAGRSRRRSRARRRAATPCMRVPTTTASSPS